MIDPKFQKITRVNLSASQKKRLSDAIKLYGYDWKHSSFDWFKKVLHKKLRKKQYDKCCYCRRLLKFDKGIVEIEHIINKAKSGQYSQFTFEPKNLALSCKDCNNAKGVKKVLKVALSPKSSYPKLPSAFEWVHPHIHNYSDHILIHNAWVYEANGGSPEGYAVITKCRLSELKEKERKNRELLIQDAENFKAALNIAVGLVDQVGMDTLCKELAPRLSKMMGKDSSAAKAADAIREAYNAVQNVAKNAVA